MLSSIYRVHVKRSQGVRKTVARVRVCLCVSAVSARILEYDFELMVQCD